MIAAYTRIGLRLLFFWLATQGYIDHDTAQSLSMDPDLIRAAEVSVSTIGFALVEAWHIWSAREKRKPVPEFQGENV